MTEWASLHDAYGSAEEVPVLLAAAATSQADEGAWDDLWGRLCHQGSVYSASYAALPALTDMSVQHAPSGYVPALHLAASIIASNDGPEDFAVVRQRYQHEVAALRAVAAANLPHATDDTQFVYGLQVLMAFEDGGVWQRNLHHLANGEASLACPSCDDDLLLDLDGRQFLLTSFGNSACPPTAVTPIEPSPATLEGRLVALARAHHRPVVAATLPYLFGDATCPRCRASFQVPQALV